MKLGIERLVDDPTMRAVFYIIIRLASEGSVPFKTKKVIQAVMKKRGVKL